MTKVKTLMNAIPLAKNAGDLNRLVVQINDLLRREGVGLKACRKIGNALRDQVSNVATIAIVSWGYHNFASSFNSKAYDELANALGTQLRAPGNMAFPPLLPPIYSLIPGWFRPHSRKAA